MKPPLHRLVEGLLLRRLEHRLRGELVQGHPPPPWAAQHVPAVVHRHPQQPPAQVLLPLQGLPGGVEAEKDLLHRVVRVLGTAQGVERHPVHHALIPLHRPGKIGPVHGHSPLLCLLGSPIVRLGGPLCHRPAEHFSPPEAWAKKGRPPESFRGAVRPPGGGWRRRLPGPGLSWPAPPAAAFLFLVQF